MSQLEKLTNEHEIDIIIPVSEAELRFLNDLNTGKNLFGRPLIMANKMAMDIGFDKLATNIFLKDNGLPFPKTSLVRNVIKPELPLVLKSRNGSGSKNIFFIEDEKKFKCYAEIFPDFIAQELMGNNDVEYTCGLFRSDSGEIRHISFKRKLTGGFSVFGVYEDNANINLLLTEIATLLQLRGAINVQLRLSERGPCVFEINPRFSSTVMFRHLMGFEDLIWSIENAMDMPVSEYRRKKQFSKFYKGFNEYVD